MPVTIVNCRLCLKLDIADMEHCPEEDEELLVDHARRSLLLGPLDVLDLEGSAGVNACRLDIEYSISAIVLKTCSAL